VRCLVLAAFAVLGAWSCHAQASAQFQACSQKDQTQTGMDHCASDEAARADAELNRTYQQLRSSAKQVPGAVEKVERAERVWIQYRDAYLAAMFPAEDKQAAYGSEYPMNFGLLRAGLTREQAMKLKELIKHYDGQTQ
jgi:uncharacterized protein YecT (DUF1311 family)